jgi:hypothetical protein
VSSHCHCVQEASSSSGAGFRRVNWTLLASEGLAGLSNTHTRAHTRAHTLLLDQPDKGGPAKHVHLLRHRYAIATIQPCIILAASVKRMKTTMRLKRRRRRMACCTVEAPRLVRQPSGWFVDPHTQAETQNPTVRFCSSAQEDASFILFIHGMVFVLVLVWYGTYLLCSARR